MADYKTEVHASFAIWHIRAGGMALTPNPSTPQLLRLDVCEDVRIILDRDTSDTVEQAAAMRELARLATEAAEDLERQAVPGSQCPDPGPCLHGPDPHQRRPTCQPDRDSGF